MQQLAPLGVFFFVFFLWNFWSVSTVRHKVTERTLDHMKCLGNCFWDLNISGKLTLELEVSCYNGIHNILKKERIMGRGVERSTGAMSRCLQQRSPGVLHGHKARLIMEVESSVVMTLSCPTCCKFSMPESFELHWKIWISLGCK